MIFAPEATAFNPEQVDFDALRRYHEAYSGGEPHDCKPATDLWLLGPGADNILEEPRPAGSFEALPGEHIEAYITRMWDNLRRPGHVDAGGRIPVSNDVFVPGERFNENYYWDNLEVMRGLAADGRWEDVRQQVDNYAELLNTIGYIPNGNRLYFLGRSQPPVFAEMVQLLADYEGEEALARYLPAMQAEHNFWMAGAETVTPGKPHRRVVTLPDGQGGVIRLNRYYSDITGPRPESICKDDETIARAIAERPDEDREEVARQVTLDLRAACESGWDFSSRWLRDGENLHTIHTTEILPVDLNCNMLLLEEMLSQAYAAVGSQGLSARYANLAGDRRRAIQTLFWNDEKGFFFDYDFVQGRHTDIWSAAGIYPVDFRAFEEHQVDRTLDNLLKKLIGRGGVRASTKYTQEQWDGSNGWGPLNFRAARAAFRGGREALADNIAASFMHAVRKVFQRDGHIVEKVDVDNLGEAGNEGEYVCQVGFGMTNGDYKALATGQYRSRPRRGERFYIPRQRASHAAGHLIFRADGAAGN